MQQENPLEAFKWERQPQAERFVREVVADFLARTPEAADLADRMRADTGTRFVDWLDFIQLPQGMADRATAVGYQPAGDANILTHPGGIFPTVVIDSTPIVRLGIKVECVVDYAAANDLHLRVIGEPLTPYRELQLGAGDRTELVAVERHGYRGFDPVDSSAVQREAILHHRELFRTRQRHFDNEEQGFAATNMLADAAIADLGVDLACDLFFAAEREYWQRRNRAAQFQKARQDKLGLGWANHDHHTYRSSRKHFARLIGFFEKLGLVCRERFYAGKEAGWGAQVMEQPTAGIIVFADVDLSPEELFNDFAHEPLPPRDRLGTVGLWCGLHGESFLEAGMHHLECQFDFEALRDQMETRGGVKVMKPFTDFPFLRQAFTEGERWAVRDARIDALLAAKLITAEQAEQFRHNGAIGSHLENLERNEGFKGFNQTGVSEIIAATDPRKHLVSH